MQEYREKPVVIQAEKLTNEGQAHRFGMMFGATPAYQDEVFIGVDIPTTEGIIRCGVGDYIICDIKGELYSCCKADIFVETYDPVEPGAS